jgi:hypothetical protein
VRPRAFAAFTLITSSHLLGACTGRSADLSHEDAVDVFDCVPTLLAAWFYCGYPSSEFAVR